MRRKENVKEKGNFQRLQPGRGINLRKILEKGCLNLTLKSNFIFKINAQITTNIGTFDFVIQASATGQSLLNDITKAIGVDEFWWFGILYR